MTYGVVRSSPLVAPVPLAVVAVLLPVAPVPLAVDVVTVCGTGVVQAVACNPVVVSVLVGPVTVLVLAGVTDVEEVGLVGVEIVVTSLD